MQKTAQKRGLLDKLIENSGINNISGIAAEKFFNPEFKEVMETLRKKDDTIRSIVAGEIIGDGDPGEGPTALKKLLKNAKSNIARREYMSATADLGWFHKKISDISKTDFSSLYIFKICNSSSFNKSETDLEYQFIWVFK